jgi:hypothetical protein
MEMMDTYESSPKKYVAPYTSLITSSMMGKSRLMKEMSRHIPCVYICLRKEDSSGYPPRTPVLADWIERRLPTGDNLFDSDSQCRLPVMKFAAFILSLVRRLSKLTLEVDTLPPEFCLDTSNPGWLGQFFVPDCPHPTTQKFLYEFWQGVTEDAESTMANHINSPAVFGGPEKFLMTDFLGDIAKAYAKLRKTFTKRWKVPEHRFTFILLFDEARSLCEISSYDGRGIVDTSTRFFNDEGSRREGLAARESKYPFSNFQALKRALRLLLLCEHSDELPYPRLFGLFTDTASHLTDFQPHTSVDPSARMYSEYT